MTVQKITRPDPTCNTAMMTQWRATFVRRWHRNPDLADTNDPISGHSARVALLLLNYWPLSSVFAITHALTHDLGEAYAGDVPGDIKRQHPELAKELEKVEALGAKMMGIEDPNCTAREMAQVNFCDKLDAYLWMLHHRPQLADDPDWQASREWLLDKADRLGVDLDEVV
jgi:hypothetical protein